LIYHYNHLVWSSQADLPVELRDAIVWRLGFWGEIQESDWRRLHDLCGSGKQSVQEIFEAERLRWAVAYVLSRFEGRISTVAAIKAVSLVACKSPDRVKQVYYRRIHKADSPYDVSISPEAS
jgi:hypothetical protein